mmetsp:Transcript_18837/g.17993  ORF Transcript_18837/g.17993 Transcript_18837/m.17993 type:complete len:104 (-) Transcript_18837:2230-2541(-)
MANRPDCFLVSSSKLPCSTSLPFSSIRIVSLFSMVVSLCAITIVVLLPMMASKAFWTFLWEASSKALVASSRRSTLGSLTRALAMAIRCFCPPESLLPLIPHS